MKNSILFFVLFLWCLMISASVLSQGEVKAESGDEQEPSPQIFRQSLLSLDKFHYLNVLKLEEIIVYDDFECTFKCLHHPLCVSINLVADGELWCELLSFDKYENHNKYKENKNSHHYFFESACVDNPCNNNATCQRGFTDKGYRCLCATGFQGANCKKDIDECAVGTQDCSENAVCNNTKGSFICLCKPGYSGDGRTCKDVNECGNGAANCSADAVCNNTKGSYRCKCKPGFTGDGWTCKASSCKEVYRRNILKTSGLTILNFGSGPISVFCHIGDFGCGNGGWTPVMKIDGNKTTFHYQSKLWSDRESLNLPGGRTGFDSQESKLPSYWNTSFSTICLGMKIYQQLRFIVIHKQADSLHSIIADGNFHQTSLGRDKWKTLIGLQASLQRNCEREGFNAKCTDSGSSQARIGILGNNENDCISCNSRIGFGTKSEHGEPLTCGNRARWSGDNGDKDIKAMGYILVQ